MGANQSTGYKQEDDGEGVQSRKACYYKILGVDRQASEEEIKKAYRKKALELHPDRNYGNVEETTKLFADVQSAYEVLIDPQERAWYDSHRDIILRGDDDTHGTTYEHDSRVTTTEDIMKMLSKVNACRDFSDSASSFYGSLRAIFSNLAREEELACEWEYIDPITYPDFGHADDEYNTTTRSFYAAWGNFVTRKSFAWKDVYRPSEAPDRRIRRLMEKENKRLRDEANREFNDAVRSLVAFVKKRDPRFKPSAQSEADRQKVLRDAATAQAARSRAANLAKAADYVVIPQWAQSTAAETSEESDAMQEEAREIYECVICEKMFRSEKQYETHERSKKHAKAAKQVRKEMQQDSENLRLGQGVGDKADTIITDDQQLNRSQVDTDELGHGTQALSIDDPEVLQRPFHKPTMEHGDAPTAKTSDVASTMAASAPSSDDEYADRVDVKKRILGSPKNSIESLEHSAFSSTAFESVEETKAQDASGNDGPPPARRIGKAKAKRAKKASQEPTEAADKDLHVRLLLDKA
ncbi:MAG: hypothetical protein L6R37_006477 [Teloschistes peruensis]|nr:MAG: hypothetical protein L6R37_006477 [Teloschistes peruensis]